MPAKNLSTQTSLLKLEPAQIHKPTSRAPEVQATGRTIEAALLTAGRDKPYALGLGEALVCLGIKLDFIGSDEVSSPGLANNPAVTFLNLRGDQKTDAALSQKCIRVLKYYGRLIRYAATARPRILHILWNNKFELFDRTLLMFYYKLLGKRIVLTVHNVNAGTRDGNDSWVNRISLKVQYRLADHIFVHTDRMRFELLEGFGVQAHRVTVIPFGINNTIPVTALSSAQARERLGIRTQEKAILFFGNIAPYKGLEYLVDAFDMLSKTHPDYRLVIVGRPKGAQEYWDDIEKRLARSDARGQVIRRIEYVPDEDTELYFKAADVLILPYTHIFQSGVLFLGYSFGVPVIATDVGSLKEEIIEGESGFVCQPKDAPGLAGTIEKFFTHNLYLQADNFRPAIRQYANKRYSWQTVGELTLGVYAKLIAGN